MDWEEPLIVAEPDTRAVKEEYVVEFNKVSRIALPMVVVWLSQYLIRTVPLMMLGHQGELALSSSSIATSLCNVTGFSLLQGMANALETLCGQAYGAGRCQKVGTYMYGSIVWLFVSSVPICLLWIYTEPLLILVGQDPQIAKEAAKFAIWLIPSLFPFAILQSMVRYLQIQSVVMPMLWGSIATLVLALPFSWLFIFTLNLGNAGAALSIGLSHWVNVIIFGLHIMFSPTCKKTHAPLSMDVFKTFQEFFQFAIPSTIMTSLEWWMYEIIILLGGLLPNPTLETSVLSICLTIDIMLALIPAAIGAAASTRISNEIGAGRPEEAKKVLWVVMGITAIEFIIAVTVIFLGRSILGYAFSNDADVVRYLEQMVPLVCMSIIMDSLSAVLSGIARGAGWQNIGAYINLGAYYAVGIPVALLLGFVLKWRGNGLWSGLVIGSAVQALLFAIVTRRMDYQKLATEARERIFHEKIPTHCHSTEILY